MRGRASKTTFTTATRAGAAAGLAAGAVSSAPGLAQAVVERSGPWQPVRLVATLVGGRPGREFDLPTVAAGACIHAALSAAYGVLYARAAPPHLRGSVAVGAFYGFALYAANFHALAAASPRVRRLTSQTSRPVELAAHCLYGAALAAALRRVSCSRPGWRSPPSARARRRR